MRLRRRRRRHHARRPRPSTTTTTTTTRPRPRPRRPYPHRDDLARAEVLEKNDQPAEQNRRWLAERGILALNSPARPGAGKTTLLERTIRDLKVDRPVAVIEGDQETLLDADESGRPGRGRFRSTPAPAVTSTPTWCTAGSRAQPGAASLLFIENVGNLVCPALFDLGEHSKIVLISVTEGADKPLKYPHMFAAAGLVIINKIDLLPYVDFILKSVPVTRGQLTRASILPVSATTGEGVQAWYDWISFAVDASANADMSRRSVDKTTRRSKPRTSAREAGANVPRAEGPQPGPGKL